jgi:ubiquitin C-terminal hydrolase
MSVIMEHLSVTTAGSPLAEYLASKHQGVAEDYLECCNCHTPRARQEPFRELSVGIKGMETLENALAHYLQPETLDEVECPHCEARHTHLKGLRLRSLPYILPIQLKRFDLSFETFMVGLGDVTVMNVSRKTQVP